MLPITKIYIDSRYKTSDSVSSSDFKVELPETISLPRGSRAHIADITIPNTMTTITMGLNDTLYFAVIAQENQAPYTKYYAHQKVLLLPGNYTAETLAAHMQARMALLGLNPPFVVVGNGTDNTLTVSRPAALTGEGFRIFTDRELKARQFTYDGEPFGSSVSQTTAPIVPVQGSYDANDPASINYMIKNKERVSVECFGPNEAYFCPFLDLQPVRNIYITSPNFGSFDTASVMGMSGIIKRVPVSVGFGYLIYTGSGYEPSDFRDVSGLSLRTLYFRLVNSSNKTIDLKGSDVSFSVVFVAGGGVE